MGLCTHSEIEKNFFMETKAKITLYKGYYQIKIGLLDFLVSPRDLRVKTDPVTGNPILNIDFPVDGIESGQPLIIPIAK